MFQLSKTQCELKNPCRTVLLVPGGWILEFDSCNLVPGSGKWYFLQLVVISE